jgi:hypothetical protein
MSDLDDILSGAPTEEPRTPARSPEPDPAREREPSPPVTPPAPPPGEAIADFRRQSADDPRDGAVPPAAQQDPDHVPVAALKDERKKRQESERVAAEYAAKLAAYEQQSRSPPPAPPVRPDLFENPDGALDFVQQQFQQQLVRTKLDMSVAMARNQYEDYGEAEAAFVEAVKANPSLYDQMMADPHPAGFAYRVGTHVRALRDIGGDPSAYREKVRQELETELRAKWEAEQPLRRSDVRSSIPPSLAGGRDTAGRFAPAWEGPESLRDILAPAKK